MIITTAKAQWRNSAAAWSPKKRVYKLQAFRTRTFESEFCMGGQIRTDDLPYKFFIPVFGFFILVTCNAVDSADDSTDSATEETKSALLETIIVIVEITYPFGQSCASLRTAVNLVIWYSMII